MIFTHIFSDNLYWSILRHQAMNQKLLEFKMTSSYYETCKQRLNISTDTLFQIKLLLYLLYLTEKNCDEKKEHNKYTLF